MGKKLSAEWGKGLVEEEMTGFGMMTEQMIEEGLIDGPPEAVYGGGQHCPDGGVHMRTQAGTCLRCDAPLKP